MNKIVVAIDFSECSINAFLHALSIAEHCEGELILLWVEKTANEKEQFGEKTRQTYKDVERAFEDLVARYQPEHPDVKMTWKIRKGKIYKEVTAEARTLNAMLIVTGTHGASGFEEFWIGSNAFKIVTYATCPVITVRHDWPVKKNLDKILLPIDGSAETIQKLPFVVKIAKTFKSEVHVVTTHSSHLKSIQRIAEKYAQTAVSYLQQHELKFVIDSIVAHDLTKAVLSYAGNVQADLIAIMTEQETPLNILLGAQAQQMINQSMIPVLSIHPRENFGL